MRTHLLIEHRFKNSIIWNFVCRNDINVLVPQLIEVVEIAFLDFEIAKIVKCTNIVWNTINS